MSNCPKTGGNGSASTSAYDPVADSVAAAIAAMSRKDMLARLPNSSIAQPTGSVLFHYPYGDSTEVCLLARDSTLPYGLRLLAGQANHEEVFAFVLASLTGPELPKPEHPAQQPDPNTPVDFCSLNLEDVAALLGGRADMHGNVWFPDPDSDGDYAKCRVSKAPGEPYGVDLTVDGDKQRILDYLVEVLGISEKSRKLTKVEKLAQKAEIERRKTLKQAEHAYNVGKAKAEHWDGPGFNSYDDGDGVPGKINCPAQPVTDGGPECVLKYWDSRKLARPDPRVFKYKPAFYATLTDKRKNSRKELIEPAHIVALTYNALTGAIEGLHYTYVDDEGNGIAHQWKNENKPHRKRTLASSVGVIKWRTIPGATHLVVAEGKENAGSAMRLPEFDGCDVWSTSTGLGLQLLPALPEYDVLTVIVDIDKGDGIENSTACAKRWRNARKRVYLLKPIPPAGHEQNWDLNDVIRVEGFTPGVGYVIEEFGTEEGYVSFGDFQMGKGGLLFHDAKKHYLISAPFKIIAQCRAKDNEGWGRLIEFTDPDARMKQVHIANAALQRGGGEAVQQLTDAGLEITPSKVEDLLDYVSGVSVSQRMRTVDSTGWHGDVFVFPDEVIGKSEGESVVLVNPGEHGYARRGTLPEWKDSVGKLAAPHRLLRLALATMFAGPLLELLHAESGGLHYVANSSKGKSTGQGMGASIFGKGELKGGYVVSWHTTLNGLEGIAATRSDTGMPLDELSEAGPANVIEMAYMLGNGRGRGRMTREIKLRRSKEFRVSVLSSGEKTIEEIIAERYGRKTTAGVQVRLVNVDADAGAGFGLFDSLDGYKSGQALSDAMRKASVTYYGTAGPAFIRAIVELGKEQTAEQARKKIDEFEAGLNRLTGEAGRVLRRFAIIAAAGELAIEADVAPWTAGSVTNAAKWAYERWLNADGSASVEIEDRNASRQICNELENYGESRFDDLDLDEIATDYQKEQARKEVAALRAAEGTENIPEPNDLDADDDIRLDVRTPNWKALSPNPVFTRYGYRRGKGAERQWWIFPETWRTVFCRGYDPKKVAQMLRQKGCLSAGGVRNAMAYRRIHGKLTPFYIVTADIFDLDKEGAA